MALEREVEIGQGVLVIRYQGRSVANVATILATENDAQGNPVRLCLDRRIHEIEGEKISGWSANGAYVSVLMRIV